MSGRLQDAGCITLSVDVPAGSRIYYMASENRLLVLAPAPEWHQAEVLAECMPFVVPILSPVDR